jgi:hypothetical protein
MFDSNMLMSRQDSLKPSQFIMSTFNAKCQHPMQRKAKETEKRLAMGVSCTDAVKPVAKLKATRVDNDDNQTIKKCHSNNENNRPALSSKREPYAQSNLK